MVFCCHSNLLEKSESFSIRSLYLDVLLEGYIGVSFFFILSGFILSYSYQEKLLDGRRTLLDFFVGRIARIYPLHLLCALIAVPITLFYSADQALGLQAVKFLANITMVHSFIPLEDIYMSYNAPDWSISNEIFFYLMFPFLLLAGLYKLSRARIFLALLAIFLLAAVAMLFSSESWQHAIFYVNPLVRIFDFILGILLYNLWKNRDEELAVLTASVQEFAVVAVFVGFFLFHKHIPQVYRFSVYYWVPMLGIIFVFASQRGLLSKWLSGRWIVYLGEISFGFYLIHQLVIRYWQFLNVRIFHLSDEVQQLVLVFSISLTFAAVSHRFFEQAANSKVKAYLSSRPWLIRFVGRLENRLLK